MAPGMEKGGERGVRREEERRGYQGRVMPLSVVPKGTQLPWVSRHGGRIASRAGMARP